DRCLGAAGGLRRRGGGGRLLGRGRLLDRRRGRARGRHLRRGGCLGRHPVVTPAVCGGAQGLVVGATGPHLAGRVGDDLLGRERAVAPAPATLGRFVPDRF